jgi:hypothetical protein
VPFELSMPCRQPIFYNSSAYNQLNQAYLEIPRLLLNSKGLAVSSALGALKYVELKNIHNCYGKALDTHDSRALPMAKFSSTRFTGIPYANIRMAVVTFW